MENWFSIYSQNGCTVAPNPLSNYQLSQQLNSSNLTNECMWCQTLPNSQLCMWLTFFLFSTNLNKQITEFGFSIILHLDEDLSKSKPTINKPSSPKWLHLCDCIFVTAYVPKSGIKLIVVHDFRTQHIRRIWISFKQCWNLTLEITFVNVSDGLSLVSIFFNNTSLPSITSLT